MAVTKQKKEELLSTLKDIAKRPSVVFVHFKGLAVEDLTKVRSGLRQKGVRYLVTKKTLAKKALEEAQLSGAMPALDGELALVYPESSENSEDITAPARELFTFQKQFTDKLSIVGGVFEGAFVDQAKMLDIAQIPDMLTLRAQFVNLINSPIQGFAMALKAIADKKA